MIIKFCLFFAGVQRSSVPKCLFFWAESLYCSLQWSWGKSKMNTFKTTSSLFLIKPRQTTESQKDFWPDCILKVNTWKTAAFRIVKISQLIIYFAMFWKGSQTVRCLQEGLLTLKKSQKAKHFYKLALSIHLLLILGLRESVWIMKIEPLRYWSSLNFIIFYFPLDKHHFWFCFILFLNMELHCACKDLYQAWFQRKSTVQ